MKLRKINKAEVEKKESKGQKKGRGIKKQKIHKG